MYFGKIEDIILSKIRQKIEISTAPPHHFFVHLLKFDREKQKIP